MKVPMEIPDRVTTSWISKLTNDELQQVEKQLVAEIMEIEEQGAKYRLKEGDAIKFIEPMCSKLSSRANTLRLRYDRICEEFARRSLRDPSNRLADGLIASRPAMPTRYWLMQLSNEELLQLERRSRDEIQALGQEIARLYRKYLRRQEETRK